MVDKQNEANISGGSVRGFVQANYGNVTIHINNLSEAGSYTTKPDASFNDEPILDCPYRSLFAFRPEDANFFFGRETTTEKLVQATKNSRLVPLLGPSGSGKSSIIFAGLVPALDKLGQWKFTTFRPGREPFLGLASALVPLYENIQSKTDHMIAARKLSNELYDKRLPIFDVINTIYQTSNFDGYHLLIIIDQFEELYTLCDNNQVREQFLNMFLDLVEAKQIPFLRFVLTLRADFLSQALLHHRLANALENKIEILSTMKSDELRRAIEEPAKLKNVNFEDKLINRILEDVGEESGNLPLLEFALTELWKLQKHNLLTHIAYDEIGEVKGALSCHANKVFNKLENLEQKRQAERIFIQLVKPGEGTEDTRRLATHNELKADWSLVVKLATERLVVTNQGENKEQTVEIVHEALIRNWNMLKSWVKESREFRTWQERFRGYLEEWKKSSKDDSNLLRGISLAEGQQWLSKRSNEIPQSEQEFIKISGAKQKEQDQLRLLVFIGANIAAVVMTILAIFSLNRSQECGIKRKVSLKQTSYLCFYTLNNQIVNNSCSELQTQSHETGNKMF